ncbi:hypothetical protein ABFA07_005481 [Porites harrisoni]
MSTNMTMSSETQLNFNRTATEYNHLDSTEDEKDINTTAFIFLMVFGTLVAVQVFVLVVFGTMRSLEALFGNQARTDHTSEQREPPTVYQFPFLPSYLMAVSETRINQQTTEIFKQNTYFLYDNIV